MKSVILLFFACLGTVLSVQLPDYIKPCKRSEPDLNACICNSIEILRPKLIEGIPELKVPSIEPLVFEEPLEITGTGLKITSSMLKAYGGSNFTASKLDIEPFVPKFNFHLNIPHLKLVGNFDVDSKVLAIKGTGEIEVDAHDCDTDVILHIEINTIEGEKYLKFNGIELETLKIGSGKVVIHDMFDKKNKVIGDTVQAVINLNFQFFIEQIKPMIETALVQFINKTANNIMGRTPLSVFFPE